MRLWIWLYLVCTLGLYLFIMYSNGDGNNFNEVLEFSGTVKNARISGELQFFSIGDNDFFCECFNALDGKEVVVLGRVEKFYELRKIKVLKLEILER